MVFLNNSLPGFAGATACVYSLVAAAELRVAAFLPRARVYCLVSAAGSAASCGLFLHLASLPDSAAGGRPERRLLWAAAAVSPATMLAFVAITGALRRVREWDVPLSIEHFIGRFQVRASQRPHAPLPMLP